MLPDAKQGKREQCALVGIPLRIVLLTESDIVTFDTETYIPPKR